MYCMLYGEIDTLTLKTSNLVLVGISLKCNIQQTILEKESIGMDMTMSSKSLTLKMWISANSCWWGALEQINFLVLGEHFLQV